MNRFRNDTLMIALLAASLLQARAWADGGTVQRVERHGDVQVSVFTAPTPLRVGPIDVSVLVQDAATGQPIAEARIEVTLSQPAARDSTNHALATHAAATNKLLQSAVVELPAPGTWTLAVDVATPAGAAHIQCPLVVGAALPVWLTQWILVHLADRGRGGVWSTPLSRVACCAKKRG